MMNPSRQVKRYEPGRAAKYSFRYAAVAAMSIVNWICMFVFSVGLGSGQGLQPVSAFNYGTKKYGRMRKGFYFTLTAGEVFCANMMFQSIWKNGRATLLAILRNLMYYSEKRLTVPA